MKIAGIRFGELNPIDSYGPGFFRVGGEVHRGMLCVLPAGVVGWNGFGDVAAIRSAADGLDLLIVGTGTELATIDTGFLAEMDACGIAVEAMPTPSACRTYNVLLAEGRRVAVALMPV